METHFGNWLDTHHTRIANETGQLTLFYTQLADSQAMSGDEERKDIFKILMTKSMKQPWVPIGACATMGFLVAGSLLSEKKQWYHVLHYKIEPVLYYE